MSHNAVIRGGTGSGLWIGVVTSGEWETFDQRQFESINGDLGGTWAPSSIIIIGGSGLRTTGVFEANGTLTANAAATFNSAVTIKAPSSYWNVQTIDGANSGEVKWNSTALLTGLAGAVGVWSGLWTFNDDVTFNDPVAFADNLQHTAGIAAFSSTLNIGGTTSITAGSFGIQAGVAFSVASPVALTGSTGFIRLRRIDRANADHTYAIADADHINSNPSATRSYTMSNTGCTGGEVISIFNDSITQRLNIYQHNGSTLIVALDIALDYRGVEIINDGAASASTSWRVKGTSPV